MDELFSESKPDLINKKTLHNFEKMLKKPKVTTEETSWVNTLHYIYNEYIKPNIFFIIVVVLLVLFLLYRYLTRSEKKNDIEKYSKVYECSNAYSSILDDNVHTKNQNNYTTYNDNTRIKNIQTGIHDLIYDDYIADLDYNIADTSNMIQDRRNLDILTKIMFNRSNSNNINHVSEIGYTTT